MAEPLFKTFEIPDEVEDTEPEVTYGRGYAFDFEAGEFALSAGRVVRVLDGYEAWVHWCVKTALTERAVFLIYGPDHGVDLEDLPSLVTREEAQDRIESTITEALLQDERTGSVGAFVFEWSGDEVNVTFEVTPTVGTTEEIDVTIKA